MMSRAIMAIAFAALIAVTAGCGNDMSDLDDYIGDVKQRPGGRIEELPQVKVYESFTYAANDERSPFVPEAARNVVQRSDSGIKPDDNRNREYLEEFPLDALRMVGSLTSNNTVYALVQTDDGLIHRVRPGNHMGQNDGRIVSITDSEIQVIEIVPDGLGGYMERPAASALSE